VLLVAAVAAHGKNGFFAMKGGFDYPFGLGGVAAGLAFTGPGALSADAVLGFSWSGGVALAAVVLGIAAGAFQLVTRHQEPAEARRPA
jgi:putative oxidoreductase